MLNIFHWGEASSTVVSGKQKIKNSASSAVNITFTKIVTDPAKSVKRGVGMGAENELFWNPVINRSHIYPKLLFI